MDTNENLRTLLLKSLSSNLPYGAIVTDNRHGDSVITEIDTISNMVYCYDFDEYVPIEKCRPYLRPMSSMTEEEREYYNNHLSGIINGIDAANFMIWIYSNHFDIFHLIEKGLAIKAPEGMYNFKKK